MAYPRSTYRFRVQEPVKGSFGNIPVSIRDLSETGLQIEHTEAIPKGFSGTLSYTLPGGKREIKLHGELRWTQVKDESGWKPVFHSGVSIDQNSEGLSSSLDLFIRQGIAKIDRGVQEKKLVTPAPGYQANEDGGAFAIADGPGPAPAPNDRDLNPTDIRTVEQARERLSASFDESLRWYNRARYALADESVRDAVANIRHKDDVLAVWEFLGRSIDILTIARVFERRS